MTDLQRYVSHKEVEAGEILAIKTIEGNTRNLVAELKVRNRNGGWEVVEVPTDFNARGTPNIGDYLVRYADGYLSWSPRDAFIAGYKELT